MTASAAQETSRLLLVRPATIACNPETAGTNAFQRELPGVEVAELLRRSRAEFDGLVTALAAADLEPLVVPDTAEPPTPDAHFPNNWLSLHADGTAVFHAMHAPSRRREVRPELVEELERRTGLAWPRRVDLTAGAADGAFLEGTGSLVLDRRARVAFGGLSPRTTPAGAEAFARALGYELVLFRAEDPAGRPLYHTNLFLALGASFAVFCGAAVPDATERARVLARLREGGREVVELSPEQVGEFAGNLLSARSRAGEPRIVLSDRALGALGPARRRALERHGQLVHAPLDTIETLGGGSARCMLAEVFGAAGKG